MWQDTITQVTLGQSDFQLIFKQISFTDNVMWHFCFKN
jgi:hypothetical protein